MSSLNSKNIDANIVSQYNEYPSNAVCLCVCSNLSIAGLDGLDENRLLGVNL